VKGRDHLENIGADGGIILKWIYTSGRLFIGFICSRIGTGGCCEHGFEQFGFNKMRGIS
jgi:hypothetical protein